MSHTRFTMDGRRRLVLVRGGLVDGRGSDGGADWQDFCHRIGWQPSAPEPPSDLEERLAERLLGFGAQGAVRRPGAPNVNLEMPGDVSKIVRIDVAREGRLDEATEAHFGHAGDAELGQSGWGRLGVAVATSLAIAAAVLLVVAKVVSSGARAPAASLPEPSPAPSVDRASPSASPPSEIAPDLRSPRLEAPTAKPNPSARPPRDGRPTPPGARVARRSMDADDAARVRDAQRLLARPRQAGSPVTLRPPVTHRREGARADRPVAWGAVVHDRVIVPAADGVAIAPAAVRASTNVWSSRDSTTGAPEAARARVASWSLSPESPRWYGATVTPPPPRGAAPASIGVMAQLDVVKALGNL